MYVSMCNYIYMQQRTLETETKKRMIFYQNQTEHCFNPKLNIGKKSKKTKHQQINT